MGKRFPSLKDIPPVFGTITFIVFGHAIYWMFWYVPSWLNYLTVWDIFFVVAYVATLALFESLVVLGVVLFLAVLLPGKYFRDQFVAQSNVIMWTVTIWTLVIQENLDLYISLWNFWELVFYALTLLAAIVFSIIVLSYILIYRFKSLERLVKAIAERMTIFLFVYIPLSAIGLVVVMVRNI